MMKMMKVLVASVVMWH
ncbi:hypothetical protein BLA29_004893 [Euroglyphus maynei]|uniref:Uncharacterized protein n=1 Tax=Euroglyphus maynei TaxID=6958 RepID=A0A1Y3BQC1_EURMA|nr:hypothetical protein BLA29_004893 [Euroglyphus maynei]